MGTRYLLTVEGERRLGGFHRLSLVEEEIASLTRHLARRPDSSQFPCDRIELGTLHGVRLATDCQGRYELAWGRKGNDGGVLMLGLTEANLRDLIAKLEGARRGEPVTCP